MKRSNGNFFAPKTSTSQVHGVVGFVHLEGIVLQNVNTKIAIGLFIFFFLWKKMIYNLKTLANGAIKTRDGINKNKKSTQFHAREVSL